MAEIDLPPWAPAAGPNNEFEPSDWAGIRGAKRGVGEQQPHGSPTSQPAGVQRRHPVHRPDRDRAAGRGRRPVACCCHRASRIPGWRRWGETRRDAAELVLSVARWSSPSERVRQARAQAEKPATGRRKALARASQPESIADAVGSRSRTRSCASAPMPAGVTSVTQQGPVRSGSVGCCCRAGSGRLPASADLVEVSRKSISTVRSACSDPIRTTCLS